MLFKIKSNIKDNIRITRNSYNKVIEYEAFSRGIFKNNKMSMFYNIRMNNDIVFENNFEIENDKLKMSKLLACYKSLISLLTYLDKRKIHNIKVFIDDETIFRRLNGELRTIHIPCKEEYNIVKEMINKNNIEICYNI